MQQISRVAITLAVLSLTSCGGGGGGGDQANNQAAPSSEANAAAAAPDEWKWTPPKGMSKADQALVAQWQKDNDGCQGGINVLPTDPICKARDRDQDRLQKRGWCWGAPLDKSAADSDWHRCGTYDSDNLSNADADVTRAQAALGEDGASQPVDPHAGDWYNEKARPKSPPLQAYENAMEPIDQKVGLANVMLTCGIRGQAWHDQTVAVLDAYGRQPLFEEMRSRLTPADAAAADKFNRTVIDGTVNFNLGGGKDKACQSIANAPFVQNPEAFRP